MPSRGQSCWLTYVAWNTATNTYASGDGVNHSIQLVKDGVEAAPTNAVFEIDGTARPGLYAVAATSAETQFNFVNIGGKSSTVNVVVIDRTYAFDQLPIPAPAANGGLLTYGSGAGQLTTGTSGAVACNVIQWLNQGVFGTSSGFLQVDVERWRTLTPATLAGAASNLVQTTVSGLVANSNTTQIGGTAVATASGIIQVNVTQWLGVAPATLDPNLLVQTTVSSVGVAAITSNAIDTTFSNAVADALLNRSSAIESGITPALALRYIAAGMGGVTAGAGTTTFTIQGINQAGTNRITATTTASGNRTAVVLT